MDFAQFFEMAGMGAMAIVIAVVAWTVRECVRLTGVVAQLTVVVSALERDSAECQADRRNNAAVLGQVQTNIALLQQGQEQHGNLLHEIRDRLFHPQPDPPAPRARRKAPA